MISRRTLLPTAILIVCALELAAGSCDRAARAKQNKPNIIIILADDMVTLH